MRLVAVPVPPHNDYTRATKLHGYCDDVDEA